MIHNVINQQIEKVIYHEVNDLYGTFYLNGFDSFDYGIEVKMRSGYWWNLSWCEDEHFVLEEGRLKLIEHISPQQVKYCDATEKWDSVLNSTIHHFKVDFIDTQQTMVSRIEIQFEKDKSITLLIAAELGFQEEVPLPLEYPFGGKIIVCHDKNQLWLFDQQTK